MDIFAGLSDRAPESVISEFAGAGWGRFKPALAELAVEKLAPISEEMRRLMAEPGELDALLGKGAEKAEAISQPILEQVYDIVGLVRSR